MITDLKNSPIKELLGEKDNSELFYKIPAYQREYSWRNEQWENIFDDLCENESGYYLGSIICIAEKGHPLEVIDGQQRLTTISILLLCILITIRDYNLSHPEEKIVDAVENENWSDAWRDLNKRLFQRDIGNKLTLSIQNQNDKDYEYLLFGIKGTPLEAPKNFGNRRISKAKEYFHNRLTQKNVDGENLFSIDDIFNFLKKIMSAFIVKIEVDGISSAFTLFESLNNRGMPLTPIDLIKNAIIGKMGGDAEVTNLRWQTIITQIESYEDQIRFLRHYYHAFKLNHNVFIAPFNKATKSNIIKIYSEHIKRDVKFIFNDLIEKSKTYALFVHPENIESGIYLQYKENLISLKRLGVAPAYSLLLKLFTKFPSENFSNLLELIEKWFIRRHLTNKPATNSLDQLFLDLIEITHNSSTYDFEQIKKYLTAEKRFESDDNFKKLLTDGDLYELNTNALRCMLVKLEKSKRQKESKVDFWALTDGSKLVWSIEHILPQNPSDKSDWSSYFTDSECKEYEHKLGNLTLTCYNSNLSNKSFDQKINATDDDGNSIGLHSGNVKINDSLLKHAIWTTDSITSRSEILAIEIKNLLSLS